ncbi:MAG: YfhO family protein [Candidatus Paraimprobicoccus trichonymphae]|uniref:YfhO family protein n=1 Tax=Candidatus Paraimprobicoccus trichonymphae TaxID=3033793 RepID=A0AA48I5Y4_9FIRM|nr:MAG: YfhO family protein [Candidatus Paraimprobicoccus trichonymphae]
MINKPKNRKIIYIISFFMPFFIMLISCILSKVFPFGNKTLLIIDANGQYIDYLAYFKTIFTDNNNFFYTFSKNLGGDMVGLSAYYLLSPLNFIVLFFSNEYLPVSFFIIILLKIGLCGLTFNYFLNKVHNLNLKSLIFSTSYALMGYNAMYFWDIMWIDCVVLLPLIVLGIHKIFSDKNPFLYIFTLFFALITNYYIGFMICIFSVIYFLYKLFLNSGFDIKAIYSYTFSSLASGGLAAFILIPTILSLDGGKSEFSSEQLKFRKNFSFLDIFTKFFSNSISDNQIIEGLPNIFCGVFILFLIILYFFNSKIELKEKFVSFGVISFLFVNFHVNTLNLIWHGFNFPIWYPYRYSFVFCFFIIYLAYKNFINFEGITKKNIISSFFIFLGFIILIFRRDYEFISTKSIYLDLFFMIAIFAIFYLYKISKKNLYILLAALLQLSNLFINMIYHILTLQNFNYEQENTMDYHLESIRKIKPVINKMKEQDKNFYRLEKTFRRDVNDSMQFNYNGISHFSSSEKVFVKLFLKKLGLVNFANLWGCYNHECPVSTDSLLGVKYIISDLEDFDKNYKELFNQDDIKIYQNNYALNLGFCASDKVLTENFNNLDIFEFQNNIWKSMTNYKFDKIFTAAQLLETNLENLEVIELLSSDKYKKINDNQKASITFKIKITEPDSNLYFYSDKIKNQKVNIYVNNKNLDEYYTSYKQGTVLIGKYKKNEIVNVKININKSFIQVKNFLFYFENLENLGNHYAELSKNPVNLEKMSSSHLKGNVNLEEDNKCLLFTIPFEEDWKVFVDNKKVDSFIVFNSLLAVKLQKGKHNVEIKYIPNGLYLGIIISSTCLITLIFIKYRKKD